MQNQNKKTILSVFGTRPEAIKMAPLVTLLKNNTFFESKVCITAQHRQMLDQVVDFFKIPVDLDLNVMAPNQSLTDITCSILRKMEAYLHQIKPDLLLVQGDTSTAVTAALAAFYQKIPIAHVEAGLRTHNNRSPWPEEVNRTLISRMADFHFAPTEHSKKNLLNEALDPATIFVTGNTVIDALLLAKSTIKKDTELTERLEKQFHFIKPDKKMILVTGHRRENFGTGFENICLAIRKIVDQHKNVEIVYPVHLNPNVRDPVNRILGQIGVEQDKSPIHLISPLDYPSFVYLMGRSYLVLTDSGGIQEEAPSLGKPVLVMRDTTERPEAIEAGTARLVGTEVDSIFDSVSELLSNHDTYKRMAETRNPYGDGTACQQIIKTLEETLLK
ncbi:MAG: UDP-N-acetylglucosamine 2-epimerase (non-hydrolyzing) [Oligoflexales bacterium]|nr:UDP-N-acetylglucosamine 2-epimerase (non-hydrolyzing) [Oligoflexales bacterium]